MPSNLQTLQQWIGEAKMVRTFSAITGNHHLFLVLTTRSKQEWIVLLGKRKPNFPFFGARFENASFYNVSENKLYNHVQPEVTDLKITFTDRWQISGRKPFPFSLTFSPTFLGEKKYFMKRWFPLSFQHMPGAVFKYHRLVLCFPEGHIGEEPLKQGHGFSEQGEMTVLSPKDWWMPFYYQLLLASDGKGGRLEWNTPSTPARNILEKIPNFVRKNFLKDQWQWGVSGQDNTGATTILAHYPVSLDGWILKREIIKEKSPQNHIWYGLKEYFVPMDAAKKPE